MQFMEIKNHGGELDFWVVEKGRDGEEAFN